MKTKKMLKLLTLLLLAFGIGSIFLCKQSKAVTGDEFLTKLKGSYRPMFNGLTLNLKYSQYWKDYASAIGGASAAVDNETQLKHQVGGQTYGPSASSQIYTGFAEDIAKVDIGSGEDCDVTFIRNDGAEFFHKYKFLKEVNVDGFWGPAQGYLYETKSSAKDDFSYLFLTGDTMELTHHIEMRFAGTEADVLALKDGKYKNQIAMCMKTDVYGQVDEKDIQKAIAYHIYRCLAWQNNTETQQQRLKFTGIWDYNFASSESGTSVSENAKRYIQNKIDGTGMEKQDVFGTGNYETISNYNYYMYDNSPEDGDTTGLYLQYNSTTGMQICTYAINDLNGHKTIAIQPSDLQGRNYIYRGAIAPDKVVISAVKSKGKKIIISWAAAANASRYQVIVSTTKKFKKLTADKNTAKTSITIKVKKKKTYYVMVRAYVKDAAGEITCGPYSAVKKVKVK